MTPGAIVDPERALSVGYAPRDARDALAALWILDERLGGIVASTTSPAIGQMRLAWWHEALRALQTGAAPAEPLLQTLAGTAIEPGLWSSMIDGWEILLEPLPLTDAQLDAYSRGRGAGLFASAATLLGDEADESVRDAGRAWALLDLAYRLSDRTTADRALTMARELRGPARWPVRLRALGLLSVLARRDAAAGLGRRRAQGSPARLVRGLALRVTGY